MKKILLFFFCFLLVQFSMAQDSVLKKNSLLEYNSVEDLMQKHPMLQINQDPNRVKKKLGNTLIKASSKKTRLFICLMLLSLFGLLKLFHPKFISDLYAQFLRTPFNKKNKYDVLFQNKWPVFFLHIFYYALIGILITSICSNFSPSFLFNFSNVALTTFIYLSISFIRQFFMRLISWMLSIQKSEKIISQKISQLNISAVILFLILTCLLLVFNAENLRWFNILILIILIIFIFIKHLILYSNISKKQNISLIQFLFYLCALEVLPMMIFGRYLVSNWGA